MDHDRNLAYWSKHAGPEGRVVPVLLEPGQPRDRPVRKLLEILDAGDPSEFPVPALHNVSPPTGLIEPARLLKRAALDAGKAPVEVQRDLAAFFREAPRLIRVPPRRFLADYATRAELLARFAASNAQMAREFLNGNGFDTQLAQDPASEAPLDAEAAELFRQYQHVCPG